MGEKWLAKSISLVVQKNALVAIMDSPSNDIEASRGNGRAEASESVLNVYAQISQNTITT